MATPRSRSLRADDGFTLAETLVAVAVLVILFSAFAMTMGAAMRSARLNASTQGAVAVGVDHVEFARSLHWEQLAMPYYSDEAPLIDPGTGVLVASEAGLGADEPLVVSADGAVSPVVEQRVGSVDYTVWRYVSEAGDGLRRVFVLVTWREGDNVRSRTLSGLISEVASQ